MSKTPDRFPGKREEEEVAFEEQSPGAEPSALGAVIYVDGRFRLWDVRGKFDPNAAALHPTFRHAAHFLPENSPGEGFAAGPYVSEVNYTGNTPTDETWFESAAKLKRICRWEATYTGVQVVTETWIVYQEDGVTPRVTVSDAISYAGNKESGRVRSITVA